MKRLILAATVVMSLTAPAYAGIWEDTDNRSDGKIWIAMLCNKGGVNCAPTGSYDPYFHSHAACLEWIAQDKYTTERCFWKHEAEPWHESAE